MPRLRDEIGDSNSTANLFLGSVRRDWMVETNRQPGPSPALTSNPPSVSANVSVSTTPIASETPQTSRDPAVAEIPDAPPATIIPSPANTLPSPVPSTCHPSPVPVNAVDRSPRPPLPRPLEGNHDTMAVRPPHGVPGAGAPQAQRPQDLQIGGARAQPVTQPIPTIPDSRTGPMRQNGRQPDNPISEQIWAQWAVLLDQMVADFQKNGVMQSAEAGEHNVIKPRLDLMHKAIRQRDTCYVVLHQVYCLHTVNPSSTPGQAMNVLASLLEDNNKMHFSATFRFANFPDSQVRLANQSWYTDTLKAVSGYTSRLAEKWFLFWRSANQPPLVTDLFNHFALPSPIMMLVMFTCAVRHLHEEKFVAQLQLMFWDDWTEKKQCWINQTSSETVQALDRNRSRAYLKFPRLPPLSPQNTRPTRPAETNQAPVVSSSTASLVSGDTQTLVSPSPAAVEYPVPSPQMQPRYQLGENPPAQNGEDSVMRQMPQRAPGPPAMHHGPHGPRTNDQVLRTQSPQSPLVQSPQMQGPQGPYNPQMAVRNGQVHPSQTYPMGYGWGPQVGTFRSPTYAPNSASPTNSPANMAAYPPVGTFQSPAYAPNSASSTNAPANTAAYPQVAQPFTFTSNQQSPHLRTHSPLSASTPTTTISPHGQMAPHPPQRASHQRASVSHHPATLPPRPHTVAHAGQAYHSPYPSHPPSPAQNYSDPPFLPAAGYRAPLTVNGDPMRLGLHLANLRDPIKKLVKIGPDGKPVDTDLFAYLGAFLVLPQLIDIDKPSYTWKFNLSKHDVEKFPLIAPGDGRSSAVWTYKARCRTVRLRCISHPGNADSFTEAMWPTSNTTWPSVFYITVNGKELQVRRKLQHMKDLPLDITQHLKEGANSIRVDLLLASDECNKSKYFFGVEVMEISSFEDLVTLVPVIPAEESRAAIQKRLAPLADDDDLAVVTDNLTIELVDPFMARVLNVPARSKMCNHRECFDRDTFIKTRKSTSGQTPMVEEWRCPICKADARPQLLIVDGFLAKVLEELSLDDQLNGAPAIQIKADGTWALKVNSNETSPETQDRSSAPNTSLKRKASNTGLPQAHPATRTKQEAGKQQSPTASSRNHEIIELD
ncbi:unnamed protein product [Penicillium bialowiezense]